ncbi:MAG: hypothetical protein JRD89_04500 [Deltaproteobacteria bacterium]|nr:hypothetical protein [Deltaproteobacteria bacterium]
MKYRDTYIEDSKVLADSGTEIIDIRVRQPISYFWLKVKASNHATGPNKDSPIARCISSIEVVDGSDVLYSLSGHQAVASAAFDLGFISERTMQQEGTLSQSEKILIPFGRKLNDPKYYLDPTKFTNPQLKITWDLATVNAVGANGFESGSGRLSLLSRIMEDAPPAEGFLMTKEHYSWTTAASGDERIDLPTDHPWRRLMVRTYEAGVRNTDAITDLKLSVDQDSYIPFDLHTKDLVAMMNAHYGPFTQYMKCYGSDGDTFQAWIDRDMRGLLTAQYQGYFISVLTFYQAQFTVYMQDATGAAVSNKPFKAVIKGNCPESTFAIPFGDQDNPDDWFQAPDYGSIRLYATQGNAGGAASVFLQQLRKYAA